MDTLGIILEANLPGAGTKSWTSTEQMRIGRMPDLEVVLNDDSISRRHAEVVLVDEGWVVRDLGSSNGTFLNGVRVGRTGQRVRQGDTIRVGRISFRVERLREHSAPAPIGLLAELKKTLIPNAHKGSAERSGTPGKGHHPDIATVLQLIRDGSRLTDCAYGNRELQRLLDEALAYFGAQRCGLLFSNESEGSLELRFVSVAPDRLQLSRSVSKSAAAQAFDREESLLFKDTRRTVELASAASFVQSATASIICAVIRSPGRVFGVLHLERGPHQQLFTENELYLADAIADALAVGLERIHMAELQRDIVVQAVTALAQAVEMRDEYTGNHTNRVTTYSLLLAEELGLPDDQRQLLRVSAALHDIGKIAIDDQVLRKPGRLTEAEYTQMKTHVTRGAEIIETMPGLAWALPVVRSHHERWDGAGYPDGLKGVEIPLKARIVSVADAFDAMTSDRPYRRGMAVEVAFDEIRAGAGKQFDPNCVQAFLRIREKIESLLSEEQLFRVRAERASNTISVQELRRESAAVKMALTERVVSASI